MCVCVCVVYVCSFTFLAFVCSSLSFPPWLTGTFSAMGILGDMGSSAINSDCSLTRESGAHDTTGLFYAKAIIWYAARVCPCAACVYCTGCLHRRSSWRLRCVSFCVWRSGITSRPGGTRLVLSQLKPCQLQLSVSFSTVVHRRQRYLDCFATSMAVGLFMVGCEYRTSHVSRDVQLYPILARQAFMLFQCQQLGPDASDLYLTQDMHKR